MLAVQKARTWSSNLASPSSNRFGASSPKVFQPPASGTAYYGQAYRWEQVTHYRYWAFVAIKAWIRQIAGGSPPNFGQIVPKQKTEKAVRKGFRHAVNKAMGGPREHEEFKPYDADHPISRVFSNPNGPDVAYDLWAYHTLFKLLCGSAHWWVLKNDFGVPVEIWVIPTHWMRMVTGNDGEPLGYLVQSPWGQVQTIPYEDVVSFYDHSPLNRWEGNAVSQAIAEWLDVYESLTRTRLATFKNGAVPMFHVALGEAYSDPDDAFLARFYSKWFARFQGENNAGKPLITGADVEVKPIGVAPTEIGFEQSEDQLRDMILAAYGVPPAVVNQKDMTYGSVKASLASFFTFSINPDLVYTAQVITEKILKPVDPHGVCFWDERVVDDPELLEREIAQDIGIGAVTPNEVRALRGRAAYPHGGDDPLLQGAPVPWQTGDDENANVGAAWQQAVGSVKFEDIGKQEEVTHEDGATPAAPEQVADTALNGAQISSLVAITDAVSEGRLPLEAARAIITASFPSIDSKLVDRIIDSMQDGPLKQAVQGEKRREGAAIDQAFRRALSGNSGAAGGYLEPKPMVEE